MLSRLIVRQRARGSPLGSRREERREAPEADRYPVVGFVTDKRYELGRRLAGGVEGPSITFLPNLPRNKQHQGVESPPEGLGNPHPFLLPPDE